MTPIDLAQFTTRTRHCLMAVRIQFSEQLADILDEDLLKIPNLGKHSLAEIRAVYPKCEYVKCISKPLTHDQLGDLYQKQTGQSARANTLEFVREWAENNPEWFYVCPIETTIHKIGYAKPLPSLDN